MALQDLSNGWAWSVGNLPFQWGCLTEPSNPAGLPDQLLFSLQVDPRSGTLSQTQTKETKAALERAYGIGSVIVGVMQEEGISRKYAESFLDFLLKVCDRDRLDGVSILEIGSGTGYLLNELRSLGAEVLGFSLVTNAAAGLSEEALDHADVLEAAGDAGPRMVALLRGVLERL